MTSGSEQTSNILDELAYSLGSLMVIRSWTIWTQRHLAPERPERIPNPALTWRRITILQGQELVPHMLYSSLELLEPWGRTEAVQWAPVPGVPHKRKNLSANPLGRYQDPHMFCTKKHLKNLRKHMQKIAEVGFDDSVSILDLLGILWCSLRFKRDSAPMSNRQIGQYLVCGLDMMNHRDIRDFNWNAMKLSMKHRILKISNCKVQTPRVQLGPKHPVHRCSQWWWLSNRRCSPASMALANE